MGMAKWVILDSNVMDDTQIDWLTQELNTTDPRIPYLVVVVHIAPFIEFWDPITWERGESHWNDYVRDRMVPLFERYGVDLVISGHQHNYQRGSRNSVTYLITGGAGGALDRVRVENWEFYEKTEVKFHFTLLSLYPSHIQLEMKLLSGKILDSVSIPRKRC